jgi:hypothetical protein
VIDFAGNHINVMLCVEIVVGVQTSSRVWVREHYDGGESISPPFMLAEQNFSPERSLARIHPFIDAWACN